MQTTNSSTVSVKAPVPGGTASVGVADKVMLQQNMITGAVTYTVLSGQNIYLDGLVGVRGIMATAICGFHLVHSILCRYR
uniref:Uncharacterized protein n=1 Tax=Polynucleobacter necessarius subsp. necessarius (strain STIR1) TaxID=452638 RepID=B1XVX5_POLNS